MANDLPAEKPADKPSAKSRNRSRHRSGHSPRPQAAAPAPKNRLRWTWREYVLQLSVVIIGIVVTFAGSDLIARRSRQRQVQRVMQLLVAELNTNRRHLDHCCGQLIFDRQGMQMFGRYGNEVDPIPVDSLEHYMPLLGSTQEFFPQSDALEYFKISGTIQSVNDDGLLMQILGCYRALEEFGRDVCTYNRRKQAAMDHFLAHASPRLLARYSSLGVREAWRAMLADPLCISFVDMMKNYFAYGEDHFLMSDIGGCRKTIAAINEKYGFE